MSQPIITSPHSRLISEWENRVEINLTESAIHPINVQELSADPAFLSGLLEQKLGYPQTNGLPELRSRIAALYSGISEDEVLVTTGAAQANFTVAVSLLEPGDEIVLMLPTYKQLGAVAQKFNFCLKTIIRREEDNWAIDFDDLNKVVTSKTKLIFVCNPDNPTGRILSASDRESLVQVAEKSGAWLLADEVCQGTERITDETTPTMWGLSDRVIATNSLSKAYGLPGARIGWVVAHKDLAHQFWATQDYITISSCMLGNKIAEYALQPEVRNNLFRRARERICMGYQNLERWLQDRPESFSVVPPHAAALAFIRYTHPVNSTELANRLIREKSTLMVPGDGFGVDHHLRVSFDVPADRLFTGLGRLYDLLKNF